MSCTVSDAIKLIERLEDKCQKVQTGQMVPENERVKVEEAQVHLLSSKKILDKWSGILGGEVKLQGSIGTLYDKGEAYDSSLGSLNNDDFVKWTIDFNSCVIKFHENRQAAMIAKAYAVGESFIAESSSKRKKLLKAIFGAIIAISISLAIIAVIGQFLPGEPKWAMTFATVLGITDFAFGACGFSIERLSDMKEKEIGRDLQEVDRLQTVNLDKSAEFAKRIVRVSMKISKSGNSGSFIKLGKGAQLNISVENQTKNSEDELRRWVETNGN